MLHVTVAQHLQGREVDICKPHLQQTRFALRTAVCGIAKIAAEIARVVRKIPQESASYGPKRPDHRLP